MIKERFTDNRVELFDPIRKKWVKATEEERVRQGLIVYLIEEKKIPLSYISVERSIMVNGVTKRYDVVVYDNQKRPNMVIECKAPSVKLTQEVIEQVGRYNLSLKAPIIGVTNGLEQLFFSIDNI